ncbi:hypothetical protein VP01_65g13, partial [Puccinia sorghi]
MLNPVEIPNPKISQPPKRPKVVNQDGIRYYPLLGEWSPVWVPNTQPPANPTSPKSDESDPPVEDIPVPQILPSFAKVEIRNPPSASSGDCASSWGGTPPPTPILSINYLEFYLEA